ncbi:CoA pyrophosphatase [Rhizobium setariae]|uniref:CoA pyrophosphatase n=1 Tax=Rhizobium setariae TaxID=2801340 RepID=UPI003CCFD5E3
MNDHHALATTTGFTAREFRRRAEDHINGNPGDFLLYGDYKINPGVEHGLEGMELKDAAVLVPVVDHGDQATVIFTKRTSSLRKHSGQIAFPGGKLDHEDESPEIAALREAEEEIGLARHFVDIIGRLPSIPVLSGFRITPVLSTVRPGFELKLNPDEVENVFEVPLGFLMDPANHVRERTTFRDLERNYYAMTYDDWRIWGITAGIVRSLYERFYE